MALPLARVRALASSDLERSGLDITDMRADPLTEKALADLLPHAPKVAAYRIPYFSIKGRPTDFYRVRFLDTTQDFLHQLTKTKERRYTQPSGHAPQIYFSPCIQWDDIAKDVSVHLIITEGEKKAACGCKNGHPTLGLGGVWNFMQSKKCQTLIPQFRGIEWGGRVVTIMYDSDAIRKPSVIAAENVLAERLTELGAIVFIGRMQDDGEMKVGLDDFIVAGGDVNDIPISQWTKNQKLHELSKDALCVGSPFHFLRYADLSRPMTERQFICYFAPMNYIEICKTEDGKSKLIKHNPAKEWLEWSYRPTVERVVYEPGEERIFNNCLNVWPGWGVDEPRKGDVAPFLELLNFLTKKEPHFKTWVEQWLAYPIQHPGAKLYTALLIWGLAGGTGKSLLGETMRLVYGENWALINNQDLESDFNAWAPRHQFVLGDEITGRESEAYADKIKGMISRPTITVNEKNIPHYTIRDCINYFLTSNHPVSFSIKDKERRYFVMEVIGSPLPDEFYARYKNWMWKDKAKQLINQESAAALMYHLIHVDLTGFNPEAKAPITQSNRAMVQAGKSDLTLWAESLRDSPKAILQVNGCEPKKLWTTGELTEIAKRTMPRVASSGVSRALKQAGLEMLNDGNPIRAGDGVHRLYMLFGDRQMSLKDIGKLYDQEHPTLDKRVRKI